MMRGRPDELPFDTANLEAAAFCTKEIRNREHPRQAGSLGEEDRVLVGTVLRSLDLG